MNNNITTFDEEALDKLIFDEALARRGAAATLAVPTHIGTAAGCSND